MTLMQTLTGRAFDLLDPKPEDVRLGEIARSLSRIPRFLGHTTHDVAYSVAQHSALVMLLMPDDSSPDAMLYALLHDAHETYLGDLPTPVKAAMKAYALSLPCAHGARSVYQVDSFAELSRLADRTIFTAFGLPPVMSDDVRKKVIHCDLLALRLERDAFMASPPKPWNLVELPEPPVELPKDVAELLGEPLSAPLAEKLFLDLFRELHASRHGLPTAA